MQLRTHGRRQEMTDRPDELGHVVKVREVLAEHGDDLALPRALWVAYPKGNRTVMYSEAPMPRIDPVWSAVASRLAVSAAS